MTATRPQLHLYTLDEITPIESGRWRRVWRVPSRSRPEPRTVVWRLNSDGTERWSCSCPSRHRCAHVMSIQWWGEYHREILHYRAMTDAELAAEDRQLTRWLAASKRGDLLVPDGFDRSYLALGDVIAERAALGVA